MAVHVARAVAHPARQLALAPYVQRIRAFCLEHAAETDGSVQVRLGDRALALEPLEFALLVHSARSAPEVASETLPVEILSLLAKCVQDLTRLRASTEPTSRAVYELQAELMLDSALGTVLLAETQRRVDSLIAQGGIEPARALSQLRHRLRHTVSEVASCIAESERARVGDLVASLAGELPEPPPRPATPTPKDASVEVLLEEPAIVSPPRERPAASRRGPRPFVVPRGAQPQAGLSSTTFLGAGLLAACLVWLYLHAVGNVEPGLTILGRSDFRNVDWLMRIESRPPSLFGQVDAGAWDRLDAPGRLAAIEELSRILSVHHYSGALFETAEGRPVAQWLESRGASLIESREE